MAKNPSKIITVFLNQYRPLSIPYQLPHEEPEGLSEDERRRNILNRPTSWIRLIGGGTTQIDTDVWDVIKQHPLAEELYLMGLLYEIPTPDMDRLHQLDKDIVGGDLVRGLYEPQPIMPAKYLNTTNINSNTNMWKPTAHPHTPVNLFNSSQLEQLAMTKAAQAKFNDVETAGGNAHLNVDLARGE
jgi:hypothetical protein